MKVEIDFERAIERHPKEASSALEDLQRKVGHNIRGADLLWRYDFSYAIGANIDPDRRISATISVSLDGSDGTCLLNEPGTYLHWRDVPEEIKHALTPEKVTRENTSYVAETELPGCPGIYLVSSGYRKKNQVFLDVQKIGSFARKRDVPGVLYELRDGVAVFSGGLRHVAWDRLMETPEGEDFKYRNTKLTRLTLEEILTLTGGIPKVSPIADGPEL